MPIIKITVKIQNKLGLHARASAKLVNCASHYLSELLIKKDQEFINGKSIIAVMSLGAEQGSTLELQANGNDAKIMIEALTTLITRKFDESE